MKKNWIIIIIALILLVILWYYWYKSFNNNNSAKEEALYIDWASISQEWNKKTEKAILRSETWTISKPSKWWFKPINN